MTNKLLGIGVAFAITLLLIHMFTPIAQSIGLVDNPGGRKRHEGAIPLVGGPAMIGGLAFGALVAVESLFHYRALFAGLAVLLIAGVLDDLKDISPRRKFIAQIAAALFMTSWGGVSVLGLGDLIGFGALHLGGWSVPFTIVCVLGLINAINMTDGVDGLAAGLVMVALFFLGLSAYMTGQIILLQLIGISFSAVFAFWVLNMNFPWQSRAKVFMGDSGSMMLGFSLTWFSVDLCRTGEAVPPIVAVWFLAIPLLDMGVVIVRRLAKRRSPFKAGRDHLHHILLVAGYRPEEVVYIAMGFAIFLGGTAMIVWQAGLPDWVLFFGFMFLLGLGYLVSRRAWRLARLFRRWHKT